MGRVSKLHFSIHHGGRRQSIPADSNVNNHTAHPSIWASLSKHPHPCRLDVNKPSYESPSLGGWYIVSYLMYNSSTESQTHSQPPTPNQLTALFTAILYTSTTICHLRPSAFIQYGKKHEYQIHINFTPAFTEPTRQTTSSGGHTDRIPSPATPPTVLIYGAGCFVLTSGANNC